MLRIFKLIPIITITFNLLSCQEIEKITLFKGDISFKYNERDIYAAYRLTEDSLSFFIDHDFSFPLFVYVPGCGSCEFSSLLVSDYIRETEAIFPYAIYGDFTDCGLEGVVNNSIVFFNQGNIVEIYDITDENTDSFKQKMDRYVTISEKKIINNISFDNYPTSFFPTYSLSLKPDLIEDTLYISNDIYLSTELLTSIENEYVVASIYIYDKEEIDNNFYEELKINEENLPSLMLYTNQIIDLTYLL